MYNLKQFLVMVRPFQCLTAAFTVIAMSVIANRQLIWTDSVIYAAIATALLVLSSSLYHCAFQKHEQALTRRVNDYISKPRPWLFGSTAIVVFVAAVGISMYNLVVTAVIVVAGILVAVYTKYRGIEPLNPLVALICTTPVLIGWLASGVALSGWTYFFMAVAYLFYLLREDAKDSQESALAYELIQKKYDQNEEAAFGGNMGIYLMVPAAGMMLFAIHYLPDFGSSTPARELLLLLILFGSFGIFAFGLAVPKMKDSRRFYPQSIMTACVWGYLLAYAKIATMATV